MKEKYPEGTGPSPSKEKLSMELSYLRITSDPVAVFLILLASAGILLMAVKIEIFQFWAEFLRSTAFLRLATYPLIISALIIFSGIIFRTILWVRYKPMTEAPGEKVEWPSVTVIMPALNEEELIARSIDSIFASNYPADKLEVVCINDGSTDGTLAHMLRAKEKYGERLTVIDFKKNLGKRRAFYSGLKKSSGEIVLTMDTDSKIGRSAIRNIVLPLVRDSETGAVAGRVAVLNESENLLTRMLSVRYAISFDFGRAYQSVYGAVFCCPGALTAYRRSLLMSFIHAWLKQRFLNAPCRHGEDRALTTLVLKSGHMVRYQSNALVYTRVPTRVAQVNRMYLRWSRSYLRESVIFARFMLLPYRKKHRVLPVLDFVFLNILHPFHLFSLALIVYSFSVSPLFIVRHLAFLVVAAFLLSLYYLRTKRSAVFLYGIPYALLAAFVMWWIVPVAALTIRDQSWLTR